MYEYFLYLLSFRVSGNFPEIARQMMNYRQVTHPCVACFLGSWRGTAWRHIFGSYEHPLGNVSQFDSTFGVLGFCDVFEWGKLKF